MIDRLSHFTDQFVVKMSHKRGLWKIGSKTLFTVKNALLQ